MGLLDCLPDGAAPIGVEGGGCSGWSAADDAACCCLFDADGSGAWAAAAVATVAAAVATVPAAVATVAAAAEAPDARDDVDDAPFREGFGSFTEDWLELAVDWGGDRRGEAFLRLESRGLLCPRLEGSRSRRAGREARVLRGLSDRRRDFSRVRRGLSEDERWLRRRLAGRRAD